jgi:spermidine synthase
MVNTIIEDDLVRRSRWPMALLFIVFFFSGLSSLIYQVAWVRILSLFFGSDVYSTSITLSVFMAGLAIGSGLASVLGDQSRRPLIIYGVFEVAIGVSALAVPLILAALQSEYKAVYNAYIDGAPFLYHGFRSIIAMSALLLPTLLMGATLPLLVRHFVERQELLGRRAGTLYAINTLGALVGTLLAGFVLLPTFGVSTTIQIAVLVNLLLGVVAIAMGLQHGLLPVALQSSVSRTAVEPSSTRGAVLAAIFLSGLAALALEVVWTRILIQSFSGTVYAFSIMLACFLFGIYYGSLKASRLVDQSPRPAEVLAKLMFGLAAAIAVLAVLTYIVPSLFSMLVWTLTGISRGAFGTASVIAQFVVASVLILGPTIMLGGTFPFAVKAYTEDIDRRAAGTGRVYSANTAGAIIGALLGGFVFLPALGSRNSLLAIACIFAVAGLVLLSSMGVVAAFFRHGTVIVGTAAAAVCAVVAMLLPHQTIVNYGLQQSTRPKVIYHSEGTAHTVDIVRNDAGTTIMMVNGNVEADTSLIQRRHFVLKAYLPLLLHPNPTQVSVVGLGLGITLRSTARYPTVAGIRLIELTPDMVEAHKHLTDITDDVLANPKINLRIDDGRNFLAMTDETFDMITADPIHPRITGVGYLYTREYYEAIKRRLRPSGVVTQWMPMYNISPQSFDVAFRTFAEVFPNATFWYVRGHGLFVATTEPTAINCRNVTKMFNVSAVREDFASIEITSPFQFLGHLLMDREHITKYLARTPDNQLNTDDNAFLEYHTPFEFLGRTDAIVPDLIKHAGWNPDVVLKNCSPEEKSAVAAEFRRRMAQIQPELSEPLR